MNAPAVLMDRTGAVGWRDIPLDGLACYHRCVEAVLRGRGLTSDEVTEEMGGAITDRLGRDGRPYLRLRTGMARWLIAPAGRNHWDTVRTRLNAGRPVLLWPDGYFWPGDRFEGRRHIHHHAVLAIGIDGDSLRFLDVDADEAHGFTCAVPLTDDTKQACTRVLDLETSALDSTRRRLRPADVRRMIAASARPLARLAQGTDELVNWWTINPKRRLAHAVDLYALGDVQPQVYLFAAICEQSGFPQLAATGFEAAAQAKKISLFLFGLHRYKPFAPYDLCRDDIVSLAAKLHAVEQAAVAVTGDSGNIVDSSAGAWLWRRLNALSMWHFGSRLGTVNAHVTRRRAGRRDTVSDGQSVRTAIVAASAFLADACASPNRPAYRSGTRRR